MSLPGSICPINGEDGKRQSESSISVLSSLQNPEAR